MEYYNLIKTIEFDLTDDTYTRMVRVELMRSNLDPNKYRAKLMELRDYNMYPSIMNTGPKGEDLRNFHSADRIWHENPVASLDLCIGFISDSEEKALQRAIDELHASYEKD